MALFFTADTHFSDHRTINIHRRPFASTAEMDRVLTENWNNTVGPDDEVWHLGDFCRKASDAPALLDALNGRIHLVRGNNDAPELGSLPHWESVQDYREIMLGETLVVLCHYPFRSWNGQHRGSVNLHGHSHGKLKPAARQLDVGVDAWEFAPVAAETLVDRTKKPGRARAGKG